MRRNSKYLEALLRFKLGASWTRGGEVADRMSPLLAGHVVRVDRAARSFCTTQARSFASD